MTSPILLSRASLVLVSLAFSSSRFTPFCAANKCTSVVFPVPGGPSRRAALPPTFHLLYHSTNLSLASSFPSIAAVLFGSYVALHIDRRVRRTRRGLGALRARQLACLAR